MRKISSQISPKDRVNLRNFSILRGGARLSGASGVGTKTVTVLMLASLLVLPTPYAFSAPTADQLQEEIQQNTESAKRLKERLKATRIAEQQAARDQFQAELKRLQAQEVTAFEEYQAQKRDLASAAGDEGAMNRAQEKWENARQERLKLQSSSAADRKDQASAKLEQAKISAASSTAGIRSSVASGYASVKNRGSKLVADTGASLSSASEGAKAKKDKFFADRKTRQEAAKVSSTELKAQIESATVAERKAQNALKRASEAFVKADPRVDASIETKRDAVKKAQADLKQARGARLKLQAKSGLGGRASALAERAALATGVKSSGVKKASLKKQIKAAANRDKALAYAEAQQKIVDALGSEAQARKVVDRYERGVKNAQSELKVTIDNRNPTKAASNYTADLQEQTVREAQQKLEAAQAELNAKTEARLTAQEAGTKKDRRSAKIDRLKIKAGVTAQGLTAKAQGLKARSELSSLGSEARKNAYQRDLAALDKQIARDKKAIEVGKSQLASIKEAIRENPNATERLRTSEVGTINSVSLGISDVEKNLKERQAKRIELLEKSGGVKGRAKATAQRAKAAPGFFKKLLIGVGLMSAPSESLATVESLNAEARQRLQKELAATPTYKNALPRDQRMLTSAYEAELLADHASATVERFKKEGGVFDSVKEIYGKKRVVTDRAIQTYKDAMDQHLEARMDALAAADGVDIAELKDRTRRLERDFIKAENFKKIKTVKDQLKAIRSEARLAYLESAVDGKEIVSTQVQKQVRKLRASLAGIAKKYGFTSVAEGPAVTREAPSVAGGAATVPEHQPSLARTTDGTRNLLAEHPAPTTTEAPKATTKKGKVVAAGKSAVNVMAKQYVKAKTAVKAAFIKKSATPVR